MTSNSKHTFGEIVSAVLLGVIASVLAAIAAIIAAIAAGPLLFKNGEVAAWSGISLGLPAAAISALAAFLLTCRWFLRYGIPKQNQEIASTNPITPQADLAVRLRT